MNAVFNNLFDYVTIHHSNSNGKVAYSIAIAHGLAALEFRNFLLAAAVLKKIKN